MQADTQFKCALNFCDLVIPLSMLWSQAAVSCQDQHLHETAMCGTATKSPHWLQVANYMVRDLSKGCMTCELLQPDELVSGLIAQVGCGQCYPLQFDLMRDHIEQRWGKMTSC